MVKTVAGDNATSLFAHAMLHIRACDKNKPDKAVTNYSTAAVQSKLCLLVGSWGGDGGTIEHWTWGRISLGMPVSISFWFDCCTGLTAGSVVDKKQLYSITTTFTVEWLRSEYFIWILIKHSRSPHWKTFHFAWNTQIPNSIFLQAVQPKDKAVSRSSCIWLFICQIKVRGKWDGFKYAPSKPSPPKPFHIRSWLSSSFSSTHDCLGTLEEMRWSTMCLLELKLMRLELSPEEKAQGIL